MTVSQCHHKEIIHTTKREYPLGGTTWYETVRVELCSFCGKECDTEEVEEDEE